MGRGLQIEADLKSAMKQRDAETVSCLRLVKAALNGKAKQLLRELDEQEEIAVLKSLVKQRRDAAEQYTNGGRQDLADKELAELAIIERYLPAQLGRGEIEAALDEIFAEIQPQGPGDMGKVMKAAMAKFAGNADGKLVSELVKAKINAS